MLAGPQGLQTVVAELPYAGSHRRPDEDLPGARQQLAGLEGLAASRAQSIS